MDNDIVDEVIKNGRNILVDKWMSESEFKDLVENNDNKLLKECIDLCTSPAKEDIFNAFKIGEPENVRVLIIGQDPYPKKGKAHGYAFSVLQEYTDKHNIDASLKNIYEAVAKCLGKEKEYKKCDKYKTDLSDWAKTNNVLLLNTALTYECKEKAKTHLNVWEPFINEVLKRLINNAQDLVVFLWGKPAQKIFLKALNETEFQSNKYFIKLLKPKRSDDILCKNNEKFKTSNNLIRGIITINKIKIFLTSHPSNNYDSVNKGFSKDAPKHFKACDENGGNSVWENLWTYINPENKV